ncbi:DUF4113 domain-containing protein, partial [Leucothrix mucor]|uniref:DinB/UmuC family translesion DNA polymerase n=1 Tax=Leucothrix mucor TaxID=45248 RepID=UPI00047BA44B
IPVSVGFGSTKTLAKLANRVSKKRAGLNGVFNLSDAEDLDMVLATVAVADVWGVGQRWAERLKQQGIYTALDLKNCDSGTIKQRFNVVLARTVQELQGMSCIELEETQADRQQVLCSRSFGVRVTEFQDMRAAITHFVSRASEKLRSQKLLANAISVHISTSPFDERREYYNNATTRQLTIASDDTRELTALAQHLLKTIYLPGQSYQRAGVLLIDLVPHRFQQQDLFEKTNQSQHSVALMSTLDMINAKMGNGTLRFAGEGFEAGWRMKQGLRSPRYTTQYSELKSVR